MTGLIHRDDRTIAGTARRRMARTGEIENVSLRFRRKDGTYAWLECRSRPVMNATTGAVAQTQLALHDIGDRIEAQHQMERNALTDTVTGLANRTLLIDRLNQALKRLKRNAGLVGVLMLDLDHFKVINDTLGHHGGDAVLISTAQRSCPSPGLRTPSPGSAATSSSWCSPWPASPISTRAPTAS